METLAVKLVNSDEPSVKRFVYQ